MAESVITTARRGTTHPKKKAAESKMPDIGVSTTNSRSDGARLNKSEISWFMIFSRFVLVPFHGRQGGAGGSGNEHRENPQRLSRLPPTPFVYLSWDSRFRSALSDASFHGNDIVHF